MIRLPIDLRRDGDSGVWFREAGHGPTILLLHGLNGGSGLWSPNLEDVAAAGFHGIAPDLPGWGTSPAWPGFTYRMPELLDWLRGFLDRHAPGPLAVVGHSFGGAAALHLALAEPKRVQGLVLVNAAGLSPKAKWHYRLLTIPGLGEWLIQAGPEKIRRELPQFAVSDLAAVPDDVMAYILGMAEQPWFTTTSLRWMRRNGVLWRGSAAISVRHRLDEIWQPTLVMVGDRDPIIEPDDGVEAVPLLPNGELVVFPGGLHLLPLDRRAEFNERLLRFLATALAA